MARLIQNGFIGEAKAGEARKTCFSWLLVHFNLDLQNDFTLQCLDLRKIDEAETDISHDKETLNFCQRKQTQPRASLSLGQCPRGEKIRKSMSRLEMADGHLSAVQRRHYGSP